MNRPQRFLSAAVLATTTWFCAPTHAAPTYYAFSGVIDSNHTEYASLTSFSGLFSFDPTQPDLAPAEPRDGYYPMGGGLYGMSIQFVDGPLFATDPAANFSFSVHVPLVTAVDQIPDHGYFDIDGRVAGQVDRFVQLSLIKNFVTDALPGANGTFDLSNFDEALFIYHGLAEAAPDPGDQAPPPYGAIGHLTSLSCVDGCVAGTGDPVPMAVPEPGTIALLFAGLAVAALTATRRGARPAQTAT